MEDEKNVREQNPEIVSDETAANQVLQVSSDDAFTEDIQEVVEAYDDYANTRTFGPKFSEVIKWISVAAAIYHIVALILISVNAIEFRAIHLCVGTILILMTTPASKKRSNKTRISVLDWALIAAAIAAAVYIVIVQEDIVWRVGVMPVAMDVFFGTLMLVTVVEATRRAVGLPLTIVVLCFILYALIGGYLPNFLLGRNMSYNRVVSYLFSLDAGVYGTPVGISSTYVFMFLLFGAFLKASKTGDFYLNLAIAAGGKARGGPAKVAIGASALFGTICGSGVANVVTTGSFTIPMMKEHGFEPHIAASVEAVASTGGMIMPPMMGAGAFVLADAIGMPYSQLIKHAIIPALIYYVTLYFIIDYYSAKKGLLGLPAETLPKVRDVMKKGWFLLVPVLILLYFLLVIKVSAIRAAFFSLIATIICSWFSKETRLNFSKIIDALADGTRSSLTTIAACASAGLVTGLVSITGIGLKFTTGVMALAGNSLFICLVFAMLITLVLSMGLNATSAYIVSASLVAPVLTRLGITPLQAHFFIFYFSCFSGITPPVCLVAYPAAALAKTNPFKVGITSFTMALPAYVLPYMACYGPELLGTGTVMDTARVVATCLLGSAALAASLQGWYQRRLRIIERAVLFFGAMMLFITTAITDVIGLVLVLGIAFFVIKTKHHEVAETKALI